MVFWVVRISHIVTPCSLSTLVDKPGIGFCKHNNKFVPRPASVRCLGHEKNLRSCGMTKNPISICLAMRKLLRQSSASLVITTYDRLPSASTVIGGLANHPYYPYYKLS